MVIVGTSPPQQRGEFHSYHHCYEAAQREIASLGLRANAAQSSIEAFSPRQPLPDANSRSPTEVLEYVRDTLRAAVAKLIEVPIPAVTKLKVSKKA
jgi:hypothetical protein